MPPKESLIASVTVVLAVALLACSAHVDQMVARFRLPLSSPVADAGAECWDACMGESNSAMRAACLTECPGVQVSAGEACQVDGRKRVDELCHTHVFEVRRPDATSTKQAADLTGALLEASLEATSAAVAASRESSSSSESTSGTAPHQPATPQVGSTRTQHAPAHVRSAGRGDGKRSRQ